MTINKSDNPDYLLVWPKLQSTFENAKHVLDAIYNFRTDFQRIMRNLDNFEFSVAKTKKKFEKIAKEHEVKNPRKAEKFRNLAQFWNEAQNTGYINAIYEECMNLIDRYVFAYEDLYQRQHCRIINKVQPVSRATPFFKRLPEIVSMNLNIEMAYHTRLKSWYSFIQKLITKAETMDIEELKTFYDIYGCKFIIANETIDFDDDEDCSSKICYRLCNAIFDAAEELNASPIVSRNIGPVSELVYEEGRPYVKDYISNRKSNGYAALHVAFEITLPNGGEKIISEVQICTVKNYMIQQTDASHEVYKTRSKKKISFDPCQIKLLDFVGRRIGPKQEIYYDKGGLIIPKELSKEKMYYPS